MKWRRIPESLTAEKNGQLAGKQRFPGFYPQASTL